MFSYLEVKIASLKMIAKSKDTSWETKCQLGPHNDHDGTHQRETGQNASKTLSVTW